jgi:hypothetical protein
MLFILQRSMSAAADVTKITRRLALQKRFQEFALGAAFHQRAGLGGAAGLFFRTILCKRGYEGKCCHGSKRYRQFPDKANGFSPDNLDVRCHWNAFARLFAWVRGIR